MLVMYGQIGWLEKKTHFPKDVPHMWEHVRTPWADSSKQFPCFPFNHSVTESVPCSLCPVRGNSTSRKDGIEADYLKLMKEAVHRPALTHTHTHQTKKQLQHLLPVLVVLRCSKIIRDVARCCKQLLLSSLVSAVSDAASSHMSSKSPRWDPHWRLQAFRGWGLKHQNCLRRNTHIPQPTWAGAGPNRGRKFS